MAVRSAGTWIFLGFVAAVVVLGAIFKVKMAVLGIKYVIAMAALLALAWVVSGFLRRDRP